ncbi:MAG: RagB/SusD family nutrient uptake outer membrane protein [Parafilimonas sp.]
MKKYKIIFPICIALIGLLYACSKDFLSKPPLGALNPGVLASKAGVNDLLIGAYSLLDGEGSVTVGANWGCAISNWSFGSVAADDSYKGSVPTDQFNEGAGPISLWTVDGSNGYTPQKWNANYDGIQRANDVIRTIPLATDISDAEATELTAEARFLRGVYHFELKKVFKNVPYVSDSITAGAGNYNVTNIDASGNYVDIWPDIEADFQFAVDNLPETQPDKGRANSWAAKAFLAKCYMYQLDYAKAKPLLDDVITNGKTASGQKYALDANFEDNFNAATDNSPESVFACQMSVNDGAATGNGNYGESLNFPNSGGPGGCCGFNNPSQSLANAYKTGADGLPLFDTYNNNPSVSTPTAPYTGTLDPRIDWTMGRKGVPYFDWGPHPGDAWIRDPSTNGHFSPKKNIYAKSQQGVFSSTNTNFWAPTQIDANNYNIIRFADVILWDAECEAQIGSLPKAQDYVNMVRNRAANPAGFVYAGGGVYDAGKGQYSPQTTPADKYLIKPYPAGYFSSLAIAMKAIQFERRLELAMEGQRFFDLSRWDNGTGSMADIINTYIAIETNRPTLYSVNPGTHFTKGKNEIFPLPQGQIDIENQSGTQNLKQNPNYQ